jgi:hypothetical protein
MNDGVALSEDERGIVERIVKGRELDRIVE